MSPSKAATTNVEKAWFALFTSRDARHFDDASIDKLSKLLLGLPRTSALRLAKKGLEANPGAWRDISGALATLLFDGKSTVGARKLIALLDIQIGNAATTDPDRASQRVALALGVELPPRPQARENAKPPASRSMSSEEKACWTALTKTIRSDRDWRAAIHNLLNFDNISSRWADTERCHVSIRLGEHVANSKLPIEWRATLLSTASGAEFLSGPRGDALRKRAYDAAQHGVLVEAHPKLICALGELMQGRAHFRDHKALRRLLADASRLSEKSMEYFAAIGWFALPPAVGFLLQQAQTGGARGDALLGLSVLPDALLLSEQDALVALTRSVLRATSEQHPSYHAAGALELLKAAHRTGASAQLGPDEQERLRHARDLDALNDSIASAAYIVDELCEQGLPVEPNVTNKDVHDVSDDMLAVYAKCKKLFGARGALACVVSRLDAAASNLRSARVRFRRKTRVVNPSYDTANVEHHIHKLLAWRERMQSRSVE